MRDPLSYLDYLLFFPIYNRKYLCFLAPSITFTVFALIVIEILRPKFCCFYFSELLIPNTRDIYYKFSIGRCPSPMFFLFCHLPFPFQQLQRQRRQKACQLTLCSLTIVFFVYVVVRSFTVITVIYFLYFTSFQQQQR